MTAAEVFELTTQGGATDFVRVIEACEALGPYCLIGGLAVNCYVEPVYTLDADLVLVSSKEIAARLAAGDFVVERHVDSINAKAPHSQPRIQFTTDERYQPFLARAVEGEVLGLRVKVARLEDVTQRKLWAYADRDRRLSKRKKDELDLIRLAEAYPHLKALYPKQLLDIF